MKQPISMNCHYAALFKTIIFLLYLFSKFIKYLSIEIDSVCSFTWTGYKKETGPLGRAILKDLTFVSCLHDDRNGTNLQNSLIFNKLEWLENSTIISLNNVFHKHQKH
jgi:hypothetical protein